MHPNHRVGSLVQVALQTLVGVPGSPFRGRLAGARPRRVWVTATLVELRAMLVLTVAW